MGSRNLDKSIYRYFDTLIPQIPCQTSDEFQIVVHFFFFGPHVSLVPTVRLDLYRHVLDDLDAVTLQPYSLDGVVGHKA